MRRTSKQRLRIALLAILLFAGLCLVGARDAFAARSFSLTLVNAPVVVTMGDPAGTVLTYRITNTNTGGDAAKNITTVEFNVAAPYSWAAGIAAPTGWQITVQTATRVTFTVTAGTVPPKIARNASQDFTLVLGAIPSAAQDTTSALSSVKATYDGGGQTKTYNNPASSAWTRKSLAITSFTALDATTGLQSSFPGGQLTVTLTVVNRSSSNWTGIVSVPQPPSTVISGNPTVATVSSPSINLNAGQTGSLVWTYTIGGSCGVANPPAGSVSFSVTNARNSTNATTSKSAASNAVEIGCYTGSLGMSATCLSSGTDVTVAMTLKNGYASDISNVAASVVPGGTATKTYKSGPQYSSTTIVSGGTATATWVYTITGTAGQTFSFTGTATGKLPPNKTVNASVSPSAAGAIVAVPAIGVSPAALPSDKGKSAALTWSFTNTLCNPVKRVAVTVPAGWTYLDGSGLITNSGTVYDDWSDSLAGSTVTFNAGTNMSAAVGAGVFTVFVNAPSAQAAYAFPVTLTEAAAGDPVTSLTTTVSISGATGSGMTRPGLWGEEAR